MPTYEFECRNRKCSHKFEDFRRIKDRDDPAKCPKCRCGADRMVTAPRVEGDIADWSNENSGKGRYCPQLARYPKDPRAYVTSRQKLIDHGKARGLTAHRD